MSKRKKNKPDPDMLFGELRGLLQTGEISPGQRTQVWSTCARMHKHHPDIYEAQWIPYLRSYASSWRPDLLVVHHTEELERAVRLAPFARFTLSDDDATLNPYDVERRKRFQRLLRSRLLAHIDAIETQNPETLRILISSEHVRGLTRIHTRMHANYSVVEVLRELSKSASRDTLESIELTEGQEPFIQGRPTLDDIAPFPVLHTFRLSRVPLGQRQLIALARAPMIRALERLELDDVKMIEGELTYFIDQDTFASTRQLTLSHLVNMSPKSDTLCALLDMEFTSRLEKLAIRSSFRQRKPIALLDKLASTRFEHLHTLDLSDNALGITALKKLSASPYLEQLRTLSLYDVTLDYNTSEWIASHPFFSRLEALHVHPYQIDATQRAQFFGSMTLSDNVIEALTRTP